MTVKNMGLSWIVVNDLKSAIAFYTEVVGLKLMEVHEQYGWAELEGHEGGMRLGIAQYCEEAGMKAGQNAVVTLTVADLAKAKADMQKKGVKCIGDVQEVPGHVKMQTIVDADGNQFQIVELMH